MVGGSCLCGACEWESEGPFEWMLHCHCSRCRKHHGAAYVTWLATSASGLRWLRGRELVHSFEGRSFCSLCSSVVPAAEPQAERVAVAAGCLDGDPGCRPASHVFVGSRAQWQELPEDGLPRFEQYDTRSLGGWQPEPLPSPGSTEPVGGAIHGSCLCGASAFELRRPRALVTCHCQRCRKGRSAAFASNVFADADGFRYVRGEEGLGYFKVPEALRFGITFCPRCGSGLPRPPSGPMVVVPAGTLDDPVPPLPTMHIFVGSKASWHEIHDDGERAETYPVGYASMFEWVAQQG